MRKVILYQLDGKIPNIALMRTAMHHRKCGDEVELRTPREPVEPQLWDSGTETIYGSLIFEKTEPTARRFVAAWPQAIVGGTGWSVGSNLEYHGITEKGQDYSVYPQFRQSIGFTQRGCRLRCPFCVVPRKEGVVVEEQTIAQLWRGEPWPRELLLLDNDFFGQPNWRDRIAEIRDGEFKVSFNQGINVRFLNEETAAAIASVDYRDDSMKSRRIYTAWDSTRDERRIFRGLNYLVSCGVKPSHIMVYMLIGYWPKETTEDWLYRREKLRAFGCMPYPMPYARTREAVGFQRWVIGAYDKRISWAEWKRAKYQPANLKREPQHVQE